MREQILAAVAANLRGFGYPDATAENVVSTYLFASFGKRQVDEFGEKHADERLDVKEICDAIAADMQATIDAGPPA